MHEVNQKIADINDVIKVLEEKKESLKGLYVVAIDNADNVTTHYSGNWHDLARAAAFLNSDFIRHAQEST